VDELIVVPETLPVIPDSWDYDTSVEKTKTFFYKWRNLHHSTLEELWIAREKLSVSPQEARLVSRNESSMIRTWSDYCEEIGTSRQVVNRWLKEYFMQPEKVSGNGHIRLTERFIVPPFSVMDTRQGYWQDRKRMWHSLGLQSELGRDDSLTYARKGDQDFCGVEIENRGGNTSIFDPVLSELMYRWFCIDGGTILDPFAGGSARGVIAHHLGYKYTGIELRKEQVRANISQAEDILADNYPSWICGDSNKILDNIEDKYDFVFSCPPYYDLEVYSDLEGELSNHSTYDGFLVEYKEIISKAVNLLREDRFACFAVGDIRDGDGMYRNFVSDTIGAFLNTGMKLHNEIILVTSIGSLPIRINKQFQGNRKVGKTHQNILIFYKGNPKNIKNNFKELEGLGVGVEL
jgi:DNA modification methylase